MLSNQRKRPSRALQPKRFRGVMPHQERLCHRWPFGVLFAICVLCGPSAANGVDDPVVALHCSTIFAKGSLCELGNPLTEQIPCSDFDIQQPILDACNVFLMVARADTSSGVAGLSVGITLQNESTMFIDWVLCADDETQFPPWPSNGGGNRIEWNRTSNCQRTEIGDDGVHAMGGFFYIYSYGNNKIAIMPDVAAGDSTLVVTACDDTRFVVPIPGGSIGIGSEDGFNPCRDVVAINRTTWGRIKHAYGEP